MTPEEAIKIIEYYYPKRKRFTCGIRIDVNDTECTFGRALTVAMQALEEIQEYREIGTVDECREAKEKQIPIPVKNRTIMREFYGHPYSIRGDCPKCGSKAIMSTKTDYCYACGQHLKWSDPEEKCESGKEDE